MNNLSNISNDLHTILNLLKNKTNNTILPTLTNEGTTSDLMLDKKMINSDGNIVDGLFSLENELNVQRELINDIQSGLENKACYSIELHTQEKTVIPNTNEQVVVADDGYDGLSQVTVEAIPDNYVEPILEVGSTTYTPGTTNQTIPAGTYLTGDQIIQGDPNLVSENIIKGVSIFNVAGTLSTGDDIVVDMNTELVDGSLISYSNNRINNIGFYAFGYCSSLTSVSFPVCTTIGNSAFYMCKSLTSVSFPVCTSIGGDAFGYCSSLTSVNFPVCTTIGNRAFDYCYSLTSVSFPACTTIGSSAFHNCSSLTSVNFPACTTIGSSAFGYCSSLTSVNFPVCTSIGNNAFSNCYKLTSVNFPVCTSIGNNAFYNCYKLTSVNFPVCQYIGNSTFSNCSKLTTLILGASSVAKLNNINAFNNTPMSKSTYTGSFGSIYVPASLVDVYKSATNWATYADRITAITEDQINLSTVNIGSKSYKYEKGMTWGEWINSDYNTVNATVGVSGQIIFSGANTLVNWKTGQVIYENDLITSDISYTLSSGGLM